MTSSIAIAGASGLVGTALQAHLAQEHSEVRVLRLVRDESQTAGDTVRWSPRSGKIDATALEGADAIVNLAGEPIGPARWNPERKRRIRESRVEGTRLLAQTIAGFGSKPRVFIHASAVGFYGDMGDEFVDECSPAGEGFLASVCDEWERASAAAEQAGIRVVRLRLGHVLSPDGGLLGAMQTPFRLGVGGRFGDGLQFWSWIAIPDLVDLLIQAIYNPKLNGMINAVTPNPVRNRDFARAYASAVGRWALLPAPAAALKLAFGSEQATEMLLFGQRVQPTVLQDIGFQFQYPELGEALRGIANHALNPPRS